jgi:hypothetical protein
MRKSPMILLADTKYLGQNPLSEIRKLKEE